MDYLPNDIWNIIKIYMLDWKKTWKKKHQKLFNQCLNIRFLTNEERISVNNNFWKFRPSQGIKTLYPKKLISRKYNKKTGFIQSYWRIPWQNKLEYRTEFPEKNDIDYLINNHNGEQLESYYWFRKPYQLKTRKLS